MKNWLFLVILVALGGFSAYGATKTNTSFRLDGVPAVIDVTAACGTATSVALTGDDSKPSRVKKAFVQKWIVNGNEVDVLLRFEVSHGHLFVDLISDASISSLSANSRAFNLSTTAPGHPSPTRDLIDKAALVAAGGS